MLSDTCMFQLELWSVVTLVLFIVVCRGEKCTRMLRMGE